MDRNILRAMLVVVSIGLGVVAVAVLLAALLVPPEVGRDMVLKITAPCAVISFLGIQLERWMYRIGELLTSI